MTLINGYYFKMKVPEEDQRIILFLVFWYPIWYHKNMTKRQKLIEKILAGKNVSYEDAEKTFSTFVLSGWDAKGDIE